MEVITKINHHKEYIKTKIDNLNNQEQLILL